LITNAQRMAETIEGILNHGVGPMNIPYDDLRIALRKQHGISLAVAGDWIDSHLTSALNALRNSGWSSVKTTEEWISVGYVEPAGEKELKHCIAGLGRMGNGAPSLAVGLHFCLGIDDILFVYARDHGGAVWRGKRHREIEYIAAEVDNGRMTAAGLTAADQAGLDPVIGDKAYRKDIKQIRANLP
jgi:hypothetical protein